jgi:hypothetical protein
VHIDPGNSVCHFRLLPENRAHAKNEIIQGLRLLRRRRNYSAHLFAQQRMRRTSQLVGLDFSTGRSISLLPVMASVAKARLIFMIFRELRLTRRLNWRNAFSYLRVREAILASLGKWTSIENKQQSRLRCSFLVNRINPDSNIWLRCISEWSTYGVHSVPKEPGRGKTRSPLRIIH